MFPLKITFAFIKAETECVLMEAAVAAWSYFLGMKGKPEIVQLPGQGPPRGPAALCASHVLFCPADHQQLRVGEGALGPSASMTLAKW